MASAETTIAVRLDEADLARLEALADRMESLVKQMECLAKPRVTVEWSAPTVAGQTREELGCELDALVKRGGRLGERR